ncbi:potassium transporter TrkH [Pantoea ananatis]|uniref:potassium transporter TrkH n=1 Tax=Pantoea ananas TaxID=553 RepID=UPI000CF3A65E|nr:potassium transporter TrkH [Pantoea ananatis]PQK77197.1 potassium transporter TrkH [Pantoea ananatis]
MTLLTLSMPWQFAAGLFPLFLLLLCLMAARVRADLKLSLYPSVTVDQDVTESAVCWLFATAATLTVLSPVSARLPWFFFILFLFRLTLTDALTGLLPRSVTVKCLMAGLMASLWQPLTDASVSALSALLSHIVAATTMLVITGGLRYVSLLKGGRENPAMGDVWMSGAVCAWLGFSGFHAVGIGVMLFAMWQLQSRRASEGGPLGPWLAAGAVMVTLFQLYQPLIAW